MKTPSKWWNRRKLNDALLNSLSNGLNITDEKWNKISDGMDDDWNRTTADLEAENKKLREELKTVKNNLGEPQQLRLQNAASLANDVDQVAISISQTGKNQPPVIGISPTADPPSVILAPPTAQVSVAADQPSLNVSTGNHIPAIAATGMNNAQNTAGPTDSAQMVTAIGTPA